MINRRRPAPGSAASAKRAAIYVRVSTRDQEREGTSLETQEARCREHAAQQGYTVDEAHIYREVHTGTELWERKVLAAMRETVRKRQVDVLIAYAIDRLSRDPVHMGVVISEADHAMVDVEFVSEPLDNSPEGQLIRFVRGYAAKIEHEKIRERTMRGRRARVESGKLIPGNRAAYGYQFNAERTGYVVDPDTAPVIRWIFELALRSYGLGKIVQALEGRGIRPPGGLADGAIR